MISPKPVGSDAVQNILFLPFRQTEGLYQRVCDFGAFFGMADGTEGIVLISPADVVQIGCHSQYIHVNPFHNPYAFTQS
jgi:hypothetical protein